MKQLTTNHTAVLMCYASELYSNYRQNEVFVKSIKEEGEINKWTWRHEHIYETLDYDALFAT